MKIRLIQSALNQKVETKLCVRTGERSQGGPATGRREEASPDRRAGLRLGGSRGRASPYRAKSVASTPTTRLPETMRAVTGSQFAPVPHAIMFGTWCSQITGEVPQRLLATGVNQRYKSRTKSAGDALMIGTASYWPDLQGYQQIQSSSRRGNERCNQNQSVNWTATRIVSSTLAATKWPAGTSFQQPVPTLRNILMGADRPNGPNQNVRDSHDCLCFS